MLFEEQIDQYLSALQKHQVLHKLENCTPIQELKEELLGAAFDEYRNSHIYFDKVRISAAKGGSVPDLVFHTRAIPISFSHTWEDGETQDVNVIFPPMEITLHVLAGDAGVSVDISQDGSHERVHPHVDYGALCFGDDETLAATLRKSFDIVRLARLALSVLCTYNPESPYTGLGEWTGNFCEECESPVRFLEKERSNCCIDCV